MVGLTVHGADIQDRDGAPALLKSIRHRQPWLRHVFADGGYAGQKLKDRLKKIGKWTMENVKRSDKVVALSALLQMLGEIVHEVGMQEPVIDGRFDC